MILFLLKQRRMPDSVGLGLEFCVFIGSLSEHSHMGHRADSAVLQYHGSLYL